MRTLSAWLAYIESIHPKNIELGLERVQSVAKSLDLLPFNSTVITVAGTNGKGSCVRLLESIYREAGYKVGVTTSPHLHHFNERLRINGKDIDDKTLCSAFDQVEQKRGQTSLTYFEFTTLSILYILKIQQLDLIILEIGLGGRLDAMNLVDTDCAIITSIDLDHMEYLGDTRELIGREKAGIFRHGKPAICGDPKPPLTIKEEAEKIGADYYETGYYLDSHAFSGIKIEYNFSENTQNNTVPYIVDDTAPRHSGVLSRNLLNIVDNNNSNRRIQNINHHFQLNLPAALKAIDVMQSKLPTTTDNIKNALKNISLPGRFEIIYKVCPVVLDVAHNPAACKQLAHEIKNQKPTGNVFALVSFLKDKDITNSLTHFEDIIDEWHVAEINHPRAAKISDIRESCYTHASIAEGVGNVLKKANEADLILIFGSFFTVAEAHKVLL